MTTKQPLRLPAPAKINLFLHIIGRREDGYHNLQTAFQFLDCCDYLEFETRDEQQIHLQTELNGIAMQDNLVYKAALALRNASQCQQGATIRIDKQLPMGAGIGGGSSNAATTLVALNQLWQTGFSTRQLQALGTQLGADVPIFIHGHSAWAEGIGEKLTDITPAEHFYLLVIPPAHVSTAEIFSHKELTRDSQIIKLAAFLEQGILSSFTRNDCETLVRALYPEVDVALKWLSKYAPSRMTGTGACVFAAFEDKELALKASTEIPDGYQAVVCQGLNTSPLIQALP